MGPWMKIEQKRGIIRKAADTPIMTQIELSAWAKTTYKLKRAPAQTTISDILSMAPTIMSKAYGDGKRRKPLDKVEEQKVCLSRELIEMKAKDLQKELCDAWELSFWDGWLTAFQKRHGLRYRQRHGEAASADVAAVHIGRQNLQDITDLYDPQDIYNMDDTGLCYAMAPVRSICTSGARGVKRWMTGLIFREWLLNLDRNMRAANRHVLLVIDNASCHSMGDVVCTNIRVEFLPPNTTTFLQPIIALFKREYRRKQLIWAYDKLKNADHTSIKKGIYSVDQLQAMRWSKDIWNNMQGKSAIQNCFRHTGIVFNAVDKRNSGSGNSSYSGDVGVEEIIIRASQLSL
ncbi:hypothetical protein PHPALM_30901 [Phytophthora palmivora]|uniref:DDE-1 domain-containing protein n=1 Tax=Phytophthora palmivora TaxID=4796 RepID=A0A2P4X3Z7_9STRA|nr:hypothetical protein PHPALM_30901 [Phytophthora palmivora]